MTATLAHIWRHPLKSHGREELASVSLSEGRTLPWDRHWAVAHEAAKLPEPLAWAPSVNFSIGTKAPALTAINARLDEATGKLTLSHPERPDLTFDPETDQDVFLDWVRPLMPEGRAASARIVRVPGRGMTDTAYASVSILNLASNAALGAGMGVELSPLRWRGNLWLEGLDAWAERDLIGRDLRIGGAEFHVEEPIVRCKATTANPATGRIDADTLSALREVVGAQEFGLYARVTRAGTIARGDRFEVL